MAQLVLGLAGAALGGSTLVGIGSLTLGTVLGTVGAVAGAVIDRALLYPRQQVEGPRLTDLHVTSSAEGAAIPRVYGRVRVSPQLIWATNFREVRRTEEVGGKGFGGAEQTTYQYFCSFALGLCEGPIAGIGQIWADGKVFEQPRAWAKQSGMRVYLGTEDQESDPKIAAVEGAANVPAFRGLAYIVFEELPLEKWGNRIPQFSVEVIRRPSSISPPIEDRIRAVTLIPGLGEFAYATDTVYRDDGLGQTVAENRHGNFDRSNLVSSLEQLRTLAPQCEAVALVVSWLGSDLRCGQCTIKPKVETAAKTTTPWSWQVSGLTRAAADVVSSDTFGPLLGGTPADRAVHQAIGELKARGYRVLFYPFVNMDIPAGNTLPDPYSDNAAEIGQPAFPWRGRITCSPAPGFAGTADKTSAAAAQVAAFFGSAAPSDFGAWTGDTVPYSGPAEWSFRRFILHYAKLCAEAGGVDAFLIGSELVGLTTVRSGPSTYPAVAQLVALAADVKSIVGSGCKVGYAADWSEYNNHRPADGSNDLFFHLDPLWASPHIDFIAIDNYLPLSDWRAGGLHLDAQAGVPSIYDQDYLRGNIEGGELYDWYYASPADRAAQVRTPITDGAYGEPWVHRYKDLRNWWLNAHHDRPGGVRAATPTAWVPQSKPIWFTEFGCPAVDKGTNQPNVFFDPKSSESVLPYFSTGRRDDLIQRAYFEAVIDYWDPASGNNPTSSVYGGPMIDPLNMYAWTWDARPFPWFPAATLTWRDGPNWRRGHWLTGRLGQATLADTVADICQGLGVSVDASSLYGVVRGLVVDRVMSPRAALAPLMQTYFFDACESGETIRFVPRGGPIAAAYGLDDLVDVGRDETRLYTLTRAQETELPRTVHLKFADPEHDYQPADVYARRLVGTSDRTLELPAPLVLDYAEAQGIADALLVDAWVGRESGEVVLPPSALALEPTDVISLDIGGRTFEMRIAEIGTEHVRPARLVRTDPATYGITEGPSPTRQPRPVAQAGPALLQILDLPVLTDAEIPGVPRLAAYAQPWATVNVFRSPGAAGYVLDTALTARATIGRTVQPFYAGDPWRWDDANALEVELPASEGLSSLDALLVLAGGNLCAVRNADGEWELLQFATATLTGPHTYRLTRLLRGQLGTEHAMRNPVAPGAPFVLINGAVVQATVSVAQRGQPLNWRWGPGTRDIDDPTYQTTTFAFAGVGLRPWSPVHLRARWEQDGDILLTWIRRTRIGGDSWEPPDVPLNEESERYDLEILSADGGTVVRTVAGLTAPSYLYAAADQTADFGAPLSAVRYRVYQVSATFGRGVPAEAMLAA